MKKLNLFFVLLFVILFANAQTYQITFTGSGASEIVDSVGIYNLTQNTSLTVDGADIVNLEVLDPSFIEFIANSSDNGIKVFPNPMNNSCQLEFLQNTEGLCKVFIVDIVGRIILSKNKYLKQGIHKFRISELPTGIYFIGVNTPEKNYSTKVISNLNTNKLGLVSYLSSTDLQESTVIPKNTKVVIEMQYFLGDLILFKGMSGDFATVIVSEITEDMIINFDFIPCTDADNNHYAIVKIEDQTWMYENLHTTTFAETESITFVTASTDWAEQTAGAYSWYDNDIENKDVFGALYNWYAVNGDSICPYGWKMPDTLDWQDLITHVGTQLTAGGELKQTGIDLWQNPNAGATNEFGFSALPGGERNLIEDFFNQGNTGAFWTSSQYDNENAIYLKMFHDNETIEQNYSPKTTGYSVRCILCDIAEIELNITEPTCDENGFASISNYDNELTYTFVPDGGIYADETGNILGFTFETLYKIVAENEQCQSDTVEFIVEEQLQGSVPTISLVENADICEDIESFFIDAFVDDYSELLWTTSGDGIFSNDTLMSPIYQFSPNDYAAGTVTLTVTAEPTNICGTSATESIVINLHPEPEIDMQTDDTECYGPLVSELGHYVWLNATATYYESTEWICTNCDGEIDYETEVIPIYLPTEMDYAVGYNDFIFKVHSLNPCNKVISEKVRVYYVKPDADAGPDQDIYGHTETYLTAKGATTGQSGWWSVVSDNGNVDNFEDYHDNLTKFTGEVGETYILTWTINDHDCWNVDSVEISFKTIYGDPCPGTPTFTDSRDGQTYNTVQIGNQCWMAENLNYNAAGSQCYDLDANNCNSYGRLYNWGTAMNGAESTTANPSEVQGVCPDGWHLPSFAEFYQLHDGLGWNDATYGVILKSELWDGTNESGFSALPGGYNYYDYNDPGENNFWNLGDKGYWWCSTEPEAFTDEAIHFMLQSSYVQFFEGHVTKFHKYSIRCVKNIDIPQVSTVLNDKVGYNSVRSGGVIHNEGASVVTTKGIVWSTSQEPTTDDNIGLVEDGSNESSYLSVMTDLLPETTYYARAFATNSQGTGYGQDISFTTTTDGIPVVEYHSVFDIHSSKAKSGGTISDEGGAAITQYGLIWSTNPNVDMENYQRIIALNESTSIFDTTMTELTPSTTYYVKAYAINSIGIAYANEVSFKL